jgi:hypothetical protein
VSTVIQASIASINVLEPASSPSLTLEQVTREVTVMEVGRPGPQGPPGASGVVGFSHAQASPAAEWVINHDLGYRPVVELTDLGGNEIRAEVLHVSDNQTRIYFNLAVAGFARCI